MTTITISTDLVSAVAKWAGPDDRPHLSMVVFRDGEMIACDGHRLVRVPAVTPGEPYAVARSVVLAAVAAQRSMGLDGDLRFDSAAGETSVRIHLGAVMLSAIRADLSAFPDIGKVVPKRNGDDSKPPGAYVLNPRYLVDLDEVNRAMECASSGVRLVSWGHAAREDGTVLEPVMFENREGATFVIMPMRNGGYRS